ncbi:hypothetical protein SAY86_024333 [Trapa natans]|uniref:Transmembrane protein n=1 Tax=Trapa natans TaxID=22666 RepID=A0AAN7MU98_TRANT|nr:hypothetical protein SAY86_024333 [Trapa natans]
MEKTLRRVATWHSINSTLYIAKRRRRGGQLAKRMKSKAPASASVSAGTFYNNPASLIKICFNLFLAALLVSWFFMEDSAPRPTARELGTISRGGYRRAGFGDRGAVVGHPAPPDHGPCK